MDINNLCCCVITEKEFVELFANDKIKKEYKQRGHFSSTQKERTLSEANRYCLIKPMEDRLYKITKVRTYPLDPVFKKMNTHIYQHLIPVLLQLLLDTENNQINLSFSSLARNLSMINDNYVVAKKYSDKANKIFKYNSDVIEDIIKKIDEGIDRYLNNALEYLCECNLISQKESYKITYEYLDKDSLTINEDNVINVDVTRTEKIATDKEIEYCKQCENIADKKAYILNKYERKYSNKSMKYQVVLKEELYKQNIKSFYRTYEITLIDVNKANYYLTLYKMRNLQTAKNKLNKYFLENILSNAEKRCDNKFLKGYLKQYSELCDILIKNKTKSFDDQIKNKITIPKYYLNINYKV